MTFHVSEDEDAKELCNELRAPVKGTNKRVDLGSNTIFGTATWDKHGEPGSTGCYIVWRLLEACKKGKLIPSDKSLLDLLQAYLDLSNPDNESGALPWQGQPLIRAVCPQICATLKENTLSIKCFVYLRRLWVSSPLPHSIFMAPLSKTEDCRTQSAALCKYIFAVCLPARKRYVLS